MGLLGACYDGTGNPSMLALHKGNHVISIEGLYVNHFDLIMGKILRIIFICTIVPGIIIWAIGRHLANSDPEAIGNSRIRMVIAMDRLLCERKDHWEEKVELIAKQCGIKCSISEDSYTAANLEKYSREGLRDATQIRIVRKLEDGTFNAHTYEGETLTRAIKFNLDLLNDFSNVTEIVLQNDFKSNWKGVVDLSSLTHVKKLICENFSLSSGYVKSCPYVEEVILKNSVIYNERGVDCTQCQNLKKVTFDNCCETKDGSIRMGHGVTLPKNQKIAIAFTGVWAATYDDFMEFCNQYPASSLLDICDDANCPGRPAPTTSTHQPSASSTKSDTSSNAPESISPRQPASAESNPDKSVDYCMLNYSRGGLRDATQIQIVRKHKDGSFNAYTYEGETLTRAITFNLDLLNDFSNVTEIVLQNDSKSNWEGVVDLSSLTHVKKLICENFSLSSGYVKSCPYVEEVILKNSVIYNERGVDCTQCQNLKKVTFDNCCETKDGSIRMGHGVTLPKNQKIAIAFTGVWAATYDDFMEFCNQYPASSLLDICDDANCPGRPAPAVSNPGKSVDYMSDHNRGGLRDATQIQIVRKHKDGSFNAYTYKGETLTRAITFNLDLLNDFSNVTEIVLQNDSKSNWEGVVDLSSLTHVKKLICENFSLSSGYVKSCPYVEEVILKNSVIYTERGVDCTQCQNLKKVTFDNCCEIRNGLTYISYGVTLPENRNVAVVITGKWNVNNDLMNIFRRFYYGSPCAGFIYDDATASFGGTMQPIAMLSRQSSVLCTARSVWINVDYENGTAWGIRDAEGGDSGPLDRISGLDEINQYPNIQKIVVRDGKRDKPLDLSCLSSIHEFECTNFTIQSGGIIFGPRAEKITINRSPMGDYPNCTRCVYLKEVHIIACSRGSLHGYPIFTGMGMEDMATEASGLRGIDLPNDHLKQITVHVGGQWYENILNALLSNLYAIGVKYVHSGATSIPLAEEKWTFRFNPMQNMDEQCKLLDIDPREYSTLTAGKIKRNYKKKAFELHPDRNGNTPEATETFHAMRNAFMQICKDKNWMDLIPSEKQNKTF